MKICDIDISCKAISLSLSLPLELASQISAKSRRAAISCSLRAMKGAFHRSLTVLVCYRFPLHVNKHQYLAFDVSLPPPNNLSCSPKQLDSGYNNHELLLSLIANQLAARAVMLFFV